MAEQQPFLTLHAERALLLAREEARVLGHPAAGPHHLLLGLLRATEGLAARALASFDMALADARNVVEWQVGRGAAEGETLPDLAPEAAAVVARAARTAQDLAHYYTSTEHLLLALLDDQEEAAAQVLDSLGVAPDDLRGRLMDLIDQCSAA
jgi:ATP-dependent Clp protease ATP-binding subunit ClpC